LNVYARNYAQHLAANEVTIRCTDKTKIVYHTDESMYEFYDALEAASPADRPEMEKSFGLKFNPSGLMSNHPALYKPVSHTIRDWMHMLVSGGIANVQLARVLVALTQARVSLDVVGNFVESVHLPVRHGTTSKYWVSKKRLGKKRDILGSFAGVMLSLIPILTTFMVMTVADGDPLQDDRDCLVLLNLLAGALSLGPERAMAHILYIDELISSWGVAYERLYPGCAVKPKFHHIVIHLARDALRIGKLLSCFVTERKHRATKRSALYTFRGIDNAVCKDMLNKQIYAMRTRSSMLFCRAYLSKHTDVVFNGIRFATSKHAVLPTGGLHEKDVVYLCDDRVGIVRKFWYNYSSDAIVVVMQLLRRVDENIFDTSYNSEIVVDACMVADATMWFDVAPGQIHVIKPVRAMFS
jgi:hypothetical protein